MADGDRNRLGVGTTAPLAPPAVWVSTPWWCCVALCLLEAAAWAAGWWWDVAGIPLSPVAVVGLPVALWVSRGAWRDATTVATVALLGAVTAVAAVGPGHVGAPRVVALVASAGAEEAVFRLASCALAVAALRRWGAAPSVQLLGSAVAAGVVFMAMPGHVAQWSTSPTGAAPWLCLAVLWCWMLWRGAALVACVALHAAGNVAASAVAGGAPGWVWVATVATMLAVVVGAETWRDMRRAVPVPVTT